MPFNFSIHSKTSSFDVINWTWWLTVKAKRKIWQKIYGRNVNFRFYCILGLKFRHVAHFIDDVGQGSIQFVQQLVDWFWVWLIVYSNNETKYMNIALPVSNRSFWKVVNFCDTWYFYKKIKHDDKKNYFWQVGFFI